MFKSYRSLNTKILCSITILFSITFCFPNTAILQSDLCAHIVDELSKKRFHQFTDLHQGHARAYLPLLSDKRLPATERVLLWRYYMLRLMANRAFVGESNEDARFVITAVPELHEKRWHPVRHMVKTAAFQRALMVLS